MKTPSPSKYSTIHPPVLFDNPNCQPLHLQTPLNVTTRSPTRFASRGTSLSLNTPHTHASSPPHTEKKGRQPIHNANTLPTASESRYPSGQKPT